MEECSLMHRKSEFGALGTKFKGKVKKMLQVWNEKLEEVINQKKKACHIYLQEKTPETKTEYKLKRALAKRKRTHRIIQDNYISETNWDEHGQQNIAHNITKHLNKYEKDLLQNNIIGEKQWKAHYTKLWYVSNIVEQ